MSNKSKAKAICDLLMTNPGKWWGWDEIMEGLIPGFSMVPKRMQRETLNTYMTYIPHVYAEADNRKKFILKEGIASRASFKIATSDPADKPEVERRLVSLKKRENSISGRIEVRVGNLKQENILPATWTPQLIEDKAQ